MITVHHPTQGWECSAIVAGQLIIRRYIGYTRAQARKMFGRYLRALE